MRLRDVAVGLLRMVPELGRIALDAATEISIEYRIVRFAMSRGVHRNDISTIVVGRQLSAKVGDEPWVEL